MEPLYPEKNNLNENNFLYFEFDMKKLENTKEFLKLLVIRDVSKIIKNQQ